VNDDPTYLEHILDAITKIETYTAAGQERFFARTPSFGNWKSSARQRSGFRPICATDIRRLRGAAWQACETS
jgi:hypothetical protein